MIGSYMRDFPILKKSEEVELGLKVQGYHSLEKTVHTYVGRILLGSSSLAFVKYVQDCPKLIYVVAQAPQWKVEDVEEVVKTLSSSDKAEICEIPCTEYCSIIDHGLKSREKLVLHNLRLVVYVASKYKNRGCALEDLFNEGVTGLIRAVDGFDPTKGYKFSTYAVYWIRQKILTTLGLMSQSLKLPREVYSLQSQICRVALDISQKKGSAATSEEIAEQVGKSTNRVRYLLNYGRKAVRFEEKMLPEEFEDDFDLLGGDRQKAMSLLYQALNKLPAIQKEILVNKWGLEDSKKESFAAMAKRMGRSVQWVQSEKSKAMASLRYILKVEVN